jgi:hypothetical protein
VDIVDIQDVEISVISYLQTHGVKSATIEYPYLVLNADWYSDIGYSGTIYWKIDIEGGSFNELHISPISGEVVGGDSSTTVVTATGATETIPAPAIDALLPMGIVFVIPLSAFSLGLAGYIIVKNHQSKRIMGRSES